LNGTGSKTLSVGVVAYDRRAWFLLRIFFSDKGADLIDQFPHMSVFIQVNASLTLVVQRIK